MIAITLPIRLVSEPNVRQHWAKKAKRVASQRGLTRVALFMEPKRARFTFPVLTTLTRIAPKPLDDDNLRGACKAVRDGIADALGIKDNDPRVTWAYAQMRGKVREYAVHIKIEPRV